MDLWVVAAVAGASYLAKYLKDISLDGKDLAGLNSGSSTCTKPESSDVMRQIRDMSCPPDRFGKRKLEPEPVAGLVNGNLAGEGFLETDQLGGLLSEELASTSGYLLPSSCDSLDGNPSYAYEHSIEIPLHGNIADGTREPLEQKPWETATSYGIIRWGRDSILSQRTCVRILKPLNSLQSCIMAHLCEEHGRVKEYVLGCIPSVSTSTLRPFYVTDDGSRIISKSSTTSFDVWNSEEKKNMQQKEIPSDLDGQMLGISCLPMIESTKRPGKQKLQKEKNQIGNLTSLGISPKDMTSHGQGSPSGAVLLCVGIFAGIISTIIANNLLVEKLRDRLKQRQNLVEDLQEELEMKDLSTVKVRVSEDDSLPIADSSPINEQNLDGYASQSDQTEEEASKHACGEIDAQKAAGVSGELELLTNIQAELEAELERLELNMKESSLHQRLSDVMEIEPDFVAEVVQGELRADMVRSCSVSSSEGYISSTSTPDERKQSVSPHELALRLHEVIKWRLEERIMELEAALEESQKRVQQLESERVRSSWRDCMHSESSSTQDSPMVGPLVMNLTGGALDAYNEACMELLKLNGPGEDDFIEYVGDNRQGLHPPDGLQKEPCVLHCNKPDEMEDCAMSSAQVVEEITWPDIGMKWQSSESSTKGCEDKKSDGEDDDDMVSLIKQLVEKARQGSPAILHAHRAMISLDAD